jgi:hypothetical protein
MSSNPLSAITSGALVAPDFFGCEIGISIEVLDGFNIVPLNSDGCRGSSILRVFCDGWAKINVAFNQMMENIDWQCPK